MCLRFLSFVFLLTLFYLQPEIRPSLLLKLSILPEIKIASSLIGRANGETKIGLLTLLPNSPVKKSLQNIGADISIVFLMDKVFDGGFQASLQLRLGISTQNKKGPKVTLSIPSTNIDLVDLLQLSAVPCESPKLKNTDKKCFVVGASDGNSCSAKDEPERTIAATTVVDAPPLFDIDHNFTSAQDCHRQRFQQEWLMWCGYITLGLCACCCCAAVCSGDDDGEGRVMAIPMMLCCCNLVALIVMFSVTETIWPASDNYQP